MKRSSEELSTEIQYLTQHLETQFKHQLDLATFAQQVSDIIKDRVEDYIYQRYRDWDASELLELLGTWKKTLEFKAKTVMPVQEEVKPELIKIETPKRKQRG